MNAWDGGYGPLQTTHAEASLPHPPHRGGFWRQIEWSVCFDHCASLKRDVSLGNLNGHDLSILMETVREASKGFPNMMHKRAGKANRQLRASFEAHWFRAKRCLIYTDALRNHRSYNPTLQRTSCIVAQEIQKRVSQRFFYLPKMAKKLFRLPSLCVCARFW